MPIASVNKNDYSESAKHKSGLPISLLFRLHPEIPALRISEMKACSVLLFPLDLMRDIA